MPQMMPLNWLVIPIFMFLIILFIYINMNYIFKVSLKIKVLKSISKVNYWQW
uniref:ATP synthase F0 subunit 8 n=1 Tax=Rhynchothorax sp. JZ-2022 TaxID=2992009 RepID=A0A9E7V7F2_9CHEL|nr:ATP synthase F0 subunit 8 [Rhynchothorax sp. JZ-2022]